MRSLSADPLVMAYEFIMLATPATQQKPLEELRRTIVEWAPGLRDKQVFWKRRTSIVKVDMLLMAYFARLPVPRELLPDLRYVLTKSPFFLEEMLKIANIPRVYGWPFGWLAPTVGALETLQCLSVALTPSARRPPPGGAAAAGAGGAGGFFLDAALLALPGVDIDAAKRLARARKIRTLTDLLLLGGPDERRVALVEAGLVDDGGDSSSSSSKRGVPAPGTVAAVEAAILALPDLAIAKAKAGLGDFDSDDETDDDDDGDDVPRPGDVVTVSCRALLSRRSHTATPDARAPRGKVLPFAPYVPPGLPVTRHERWWVVVGDASSNTCFAAKRVDLRAAEDAAFEARRAGATTGLGGDAEVLAFVESRMIGKTNNPEAGASAEVKAAGAGKKGSSAAALAKPNSAPSLASLRPPPVARANTMGPYALPQASNAGAAAAAAEHGARFEVQFEAPPRPGRYNLTLMLLCDSSVGSDRAMPLRLRVAEQSRAEREGRVAAQQAAAKAAKKKKKAAAKKSGKSNGKSSSEITVASEDGGAVVEEEDDDEEATSSDDEAAASSSGDEDAAAGDSSSDDEDDEEDGNGEWDSEESGSEASGVTSSDESESEEAEEEESSDEGEEEEEEESSAEGEEDDSSAAATSTRPSTGATTTTAASDDDEEEEEEESNDEDDDEDAEESSSGGEEEAAAEEEEEENEEEEATPSPAAAKATKPSTATTNVAVAAE